MRSEMYGVTGTQTNINNDAYILNKPSIPTEFGRVKMFRSDWNETDILADAYVLNKPVLIEYY